MNNLNALRVGFALGGLLGLWHLVWSVLVAIGWAQPLIGWIFQLHMMRPPFTVMPFDIGMAALLVIVTSVFGCVLGWVFATIWNAVRK